MDKIYNKYIHNITRSEFRNVNPITDQNFNKPNNITEFKLDHGDCFYNGRIQYHITGKVVQKDDGNEYAANTNVKLIDNFIPHLFPMIEMRKNGVLIERIEHAGITSTVKSMVSYKHSQKKLLSASGFESKFTGGGRFEALGTLSHLGFGFFNHLRFPIFKGGFEISFTRAEDNDAIFHWKGSETGATEPADGKVLIDSFVLRVPLVEYEQTSKIQLLDELKSLSDSGKLIYNFLLWQGIEKKGVYGSNFSWDITGLFRNIYNPMFVMICLQSDRSNNQRKDPSKFDNSNLKNATVKIDGIRYPEELQNFHVTNGKFRVLYDMYQNFRRVMHGDEEAYLEYDDFVSNYTIVVIDTSLHPRNKIRSKSDIIVELDFVNPIAPPTANSGTSAYVTIVSEAHMKYDITRNLVELI